MTDQPREEKGTIHDFPLRVGVLRKLEVGQEIVSSPTRVVMRQFQSTEPRNSEQIMAVPGPQIIKACSDWFNNTFTGNYMLDEIHAKFPSYLQPNEHIVITCRPENVLSGSGKRGPMSEFSLSCTSAERPGRDIARIQFKVFRPAQ